MLRMFWRLSGWKISGFWRFVIKRVFVGFVGCVRGGRFERSSLRELRDDDRDLVFGLEGSDKLELLEPLKAVATGLSLGLSIVGCLISEFITASIGRINRGLDCWFRMCC